MPFKEFVVELCGTTNHCRNLVSIAERTFDYCFHLDQCLNYMKARVCEVPLLTFMAPNFAKVTGYRVDRPI